MAGETVSDIQDTISTEYSREINIHISTEIKFASQEIVTDCHYVIALRTPIFLILA